MPDNKPLDTEHVLAVPKVPEAASKPLTEDKKESPVPLAAAASQPEKTDAAVAKQASIVSRALHHVDADFKKEVAFLEQVVLRAKKSGTTFAEAREKHRQEADALKVQQEAQRRQADADFYASKKRGN